MELFKYRAQLLPRITLCGQQASSAPFCNIRRISGDYIFYFVTAGDVYLQEADTAYHLKKGDCLMLEPGKLHYGIRPSLYKLYYIHFTHPDAEKITLSQTEHLEKTRTSHWSWCSSLENGPFPEDRISIRKYACIEDTAAFTAICGMMEQLLNARQIHLEHYDTLCGCLTTRIFTELWRHQNIQLLNASNRGTQWSERIDMVISYLNSNYSRKLTSDTIERELSYNFDYLNQLFCKHLHISIFKMLENIRMQAAKNLLLTHPLTVRQIANEVGYTDEAYFSKVFKHHTGITPGKYKKGARSTVG